MYFATETATATATAMDTECWKSAKSQPWYPKQIQVFNENNHIVIAVRMLVQHAYVTNGNGQTTIIINICGSLQAR